MARPKKVQSDTLIGLINQYFESNDNNPKVLKYSLIATYLQQLNYDIKEYDIRRNKEVSAFIRQLLEKSTLQHQINNVLVFKNLDVDEFIKNNMSLPSLKKALVERDCYYLNLYETVCKFNDEYTNIRNKYIKEQEVLNMLKQESAEKSNEIGNYKKMLNSLKVENKLLRNILKSNVYPEIANKLLKEQGLLIGGEDCISLEGQDRILTDSDSIISKIKKGEHENNTFKSECSSVVQTLFNKI